MRVWISLLMIIFCSACSVNIIQNTGRGADILEDNDKYDVDADVDFSPKIEAEMSAV